MTTRVTSTKPVLTTSSTSRAISGSMVNPLPIGWTVALPTRGLEMCRIFGARVSLLGAYGDGPRASTSWCEQTTDGRGQQPSSVRSSSCAGSGTRASSPQAAPGDQHGQGVAEVAAAPDQQLHRVVELAGVRAVGVEHGPPRTSSWPAAAAARWAVRPADRRRRVGAQVGESDQLVAERPHLPVGHRRSHRRQRDVGVGHRLDVQLGQQLDGPHGRRAADGRDRPQHQWCRTPGGPSRRWSRPSRAAGRRCGRSPAWLSTTGSRHRPSR